MLLNGLLIDDGVGRGIALAVRRGHLDDRAVPGELVEAFRGTGFVGDDESD